MFKNLSGKFLVLRTASDYLMSSPGEVGITVSSIIHLPLDVRYFFAYSSLTLNRMILAH